MMCFSKKKEDAPVVKDQCVKTVGIAYTADQLASFVALGLCVEYKADSLKLYAYMPEHWYQHRNSRIDFFKD